MYKVIFNLLCKEVEFYVDDNLVATKSLDEVTNGNLPDNFKISNNGVFYYEKDNKKYPVLAKSKFNFIFELGLQGVTNGE